MGKLRFFLACLLGAFVTAILGTLMSTHRVIEGSVALSDTYAAKMTFGTRLSMMGQDILGLGPILLILVLIAFLVAMGLAIILSRRFTRLALPIFLTAGFVAMLVLFRLLKFATFNVDIVAGTRDITGYILMGLAGMVGAFIVYRRYRKSILAV